MSNAAQDAKRVAALVQVIDAMARGEAQTLGGIASDVFGWSPERVFLAIDAAITAKLIARNDEEASDGPRSFGKTASIT
jgi:hypothetical protein